MMAANHIERHLATKVLSLLLPKTKIKFKLF